jgi:hypothetical protein
MGQHAYAMLDVARSSGDLHKLASRMPAAALRKGYRRFAVFSE